MPLIRCAIFLHPFDAELLHFLRRVDINGRGEGPVYETKALIFLALARHSSRHSGHPFSWLPQLGKTCSLCDYFF
jgi:hypothetical protein